MEALKKTNGLHLNRLKAKGSSVNLHNIKKREPFTPKEWGKGFGQFVDIEAAKQLSHQSEDQKRLQEWDNKWGSYIRNYCQKVRCSWAK